MPSAAGSSGRRDPLAPLRSNTKLVYRLTSIVERLEPERLFGAPGPLEVELGCGDGSFLVARAQGHPHANFLGLERLVGRLRKLDRKAQRAGLKNVAGLRIEAAYCLEYLLPTNSASALHVYFPDPWPKKRHLRRRLVDDRFPGLASGVLGTAGRVYLRTDDPDYYEQMRSSFAGAKAFREVPTPEAIAGIRTDFEAAFNAEGKPTLRLAYEKRRC